MVLVTRISTQPEIAAPFTFSVRSSVMGATNLKACATWAALTLLGACDASPANTTSAAAAPPPSHNYDVYEDGKYGYTVALSDDERKAGQTAENVIMFKYLGRGANGHYTLESDDNGLFSYAQCLNPCAVIDIEQGAGYYSETQHVAFSPQSVLGEAFEDAFNGQLQVYHDPQAAIAAPQPQPTADRPPLSNGN